MATQPRALLIACTALVGLALPALAAPDVQTRMLLRQAQIPGLPPVSFNLDEESTQRYAFVVGNASYDHVSDLANAGNDARAVAEMLRARGYIVAEFHDLRKRDFEAALRQMLHDTEVGAEMLFYYAGHGVQIGNRNYLLPTDADIDTVYDVPFMSISLSSVLALSSSRSRSLVAILDSCRDNPFAGESGYVTLDGTPSALQTGFSAQETPINSYVVFSTSPGAVAFDGEGDNSPFTAALLESVAETPEAPLSDVLKTVRRKVYSATSQLQVPWESSSLVEPISFGPVVGEVTSVSQSSLLPELGTGATSASLRIQSRLNPRVPIGDVLGENLSETGTTSVAAPPAEGRIEVRRDGRYVSVRPGSVLEIEDLPSVTYRPSMSQMMGLTEPRIGDRFVLSDGAALKEVALELGVDQCDVEAGDHLDPQGVGQVRFPNEIEPLKALAACRAAVLEDPQNGRFHYQLGRAQLALRNFDAAEASYIRAQELGHTRAIHGRGVIEVARVKATGGADAGRVPERALGFFAAGVERGDPYAYHSLGLQLLTHPEDDLEERKGFELLSRSLELGHTFSMNALGLYFLDDESAHYNFERGMRYLRESYARGDIYGAANLGFVAANGLGSEARNPEVALALFSEAASGGHPSAPSSIGRLYNSDALGTPNYREAIRWYDIGLERGDAWGGSNAAWIIANRTPEGFTQGDAALRAAQAATLRNADAAQAAQRVLDGLPPAAIDAGAQAFMARLGAEVSVDGAFGPASQAALDALAAEHDRRFAADPMGRLLDLAQLSWELSSFRVDLY
ncbi:MAG: caspase family protein [Pseudomonadota bacterium]